MEKLCLSETSMHVFNQNYLLLTYPMIISPHPWSAFSHEIKNEIQIEIENENYNEIQI